MGGEKVVKYEPQSVGYQQTNVINYTGGGIVIEPRKAIPMQPLALPVEVSKPNPIRYLLSHDIPINGSYRVGDSIVVDYYVSLSPNIQRYSNSIAEIGGVNSKVEARLYFADGGVTKPDTAEQRLYKGALGSAYPSSAVYLHYQWRRTVTNLKDMRVGIGFEIVAGSGDNANWQRSMFVRETVDITVQTASLNPVNYEDYPLDFEQLDREAAYIRSNRDESKHQDEPGNISWFGRKERDFA